MRFELVSERADMEFVRDGKTYNTATATKLHSAGQTSILLTKSIETLYISPQGQPFMVTEYPDSDRVEATLLTQEKALSWLDENNAPVSAYNGLGVEVTEG